MLIVLQHIFIPMQKNRTENDTFAVDLDPLLESYVVPIGVEPSLIIFFTCLIIVITLITAEIYTQKKKREMHLYSSNESEPQMFLQPITTKEDHWSTTTSEGPEGRSLEGPSEGQ